MPNIQKWGFGMAPLKPKTAKKNLQSIIAVKNFVAATGVTNLNSIIDDISQVKGIFNRVIKQNQWDWFTVNMYLDYPTHDDLINIVASLNSLRKAILTNDSILASNALDYLTNGNFLTYCYNYITFNINAEPSSEYLYILSRREEKDLLKIGMTTRNIQKRVSEINSATGVLFPFSARRVYKVKDSKKVEKEIHTLLSKYRIRPDREFFRIDYTKACSLIENYLITNNQYFYKSK